MSYRTHIANQCKRAVDKQLKALPVIAQDYSAIPENARVSNRLSGRAHFNHYRYRRRGYLLHIEVEGLVRIGARKIIGDESRQLALMNAWLKGVIWPPLLIIAKVIDDNWVVQTIRDYDFALFLVEQGQRYLHAQLIENPDVAATKANLALLGKGLFNRRGDCCPVNASRIAY